MTGTVLICLMLNQRLKQSPGLPNWPVTSTLFKQRGTILKHSLLPRQITAATTWCRQRARPIRPLLLVCPSMAGKAGQHMHEADSDSRRGSGVRRPGRAAYQRWGDRWVGGVRCRCLHHRLRRPGHLSPSHHGNQVRWQHHHCQEHHQLRGAL